MLVTGWYSTDQSAGIRVARITEHLLDRARFDDAAAVHHNDAITELRNERKIMRDEHHGHLALTPHPRNDRHDLGLQGRVKRRGWLVCN